VAIIDNPDSSPTIERHLCLFVIIVPRIEWWCASATPVIEDMRTIRTQSLYTDFRPNSALELHHVLFGA
ncbi:hypothetical protein PMAYCL1PPCAC_08052, partial [Pristionchus mayeri]